MILDGLVARDLAQVDGKTAEGESVVKIDDEVTERVTLAQLYGMFLADVLQSESH